MLKRLAFRSLGSTAQLPSEGGLVPRMYGPPRDCKDKVGREDKSAQMYSAFGWRSSLLARMRCARVSPYKRRGRWRPFSVSGFWHVVVNVLSSLLPYADLGGRALRVVVVVRVKWERGALPSRRRLFRA